MPKGFNRTGQQRDLRPHIFKTQKEQNENWAYDHLNIPAWKHQNDKGHIFIRGYMPRLNQGFLHIILEGDYDSIKAHEIDINAID